MTGYELDEIRSRQASMIDDGDKRIRYDRDALLTELDRQLTKVAKLRELVDYMYDEIHHQPTQNHIAKALEEVDRI